mmetsp:Transcript_66644/g.152602  ORF Transcript_66644/g.152602 Transcript_66644/m.152602 type:complete len:306 (-) Transcript_66644:126-1043(-)
MFGSRTAAVTNGSMKPYPISFVFVDFGQLQRKKATTTAPGWRVVTKNRPAIVKECSTALAQNITKLPPPKMKVSEWAKAPTTRSRSCYEKPTAASNKRDVVRSGRWRPVSSTGRRASRSRPERSYRVSPAHFCGRCRPTTAPASQKYEETIHFYTGAGQQYLNPSMAPPGSLKDKKEVVRTDTLPAQKYNWGSAQKCYWGRSSSPEYKGIGVLQSPMFEVSTAGKFVPSSLRSRSPVEREARNKGANENPPRRRQHNPSQSNTNQIIGSYPEESVRDCNNNDDSSTEKKGGGMQSKVEVPMLPSF